MRAIRTIFAALLATFAIVAFQSDAYAQTQRGESRSTGASRSASRSTTVTRTTPQNTKHTGRTVTRSTSSDKKQPVTRPSSRPRPSVNTDRKPSTTVTRPVQSRPSRPTVSGSGGGVKISGQKVDRNNKPSADRPSAARPGNSVQRPQRNNPNVGKPAAGPSDRPSARPNDKPKPGGDRHMQPIRPDHRPEAHRVHPRDRDFLPYNRPSRFWGHHDHCFGHRVRVLPAHVRRHVHFGITYYCYDDVWYRPYGGYYVVCRPPFGTVLAANLIADMTWAAVRYSYYNTVANTYSQINENNRYIAEQNAVIAQNNATIAAQNQTIAMNQQLASQAYTLANELGLVQSYAAANSNYFYQDGIFYMMDSDGEYKVILPPAGALVETLPEDYDLVTLKDNNEYYKVDDTVYKITISDGKPYFEVLGQLYA